MQYCRPERNVLLSGADAYPPSHGRGKRKRDDGVWDPVRRDRLNDFPSPPNMRHSFHREQRASSPSIREHRDDYSDRPRSTGHDHYQPPHRLSSLSRPSGTSAPHSSDAVPPKPTRIYRNMVWTKPLTPPPPSLESPASPCDQPSGSPPRTGKYVELPVDDYSSLRSAPTLTTWRKDSGRHILTPSTEPQNSILDPDYHHANHKFRLPTNSPYQRPSASKLTTEVNGIKGVPVGPSRTARPLPVDIQVKRSPHIFVSSAHLPASSSLRLHLADFVSRYKPDKILMDETGYFITFPDNPHGQMNLTLCQLNRGGSTNKLCNTYPLIMRPYPAGHNTGVQTGSPAMKSAVSHALIRQPEQLGKALEKPPEERREPTQAARLPGAEDKHACEAPGLRSFEEQLPVSDTVQPASQASTKDANGRQPSEAHTFPLHAVSRLDRDNEASFTSELESDISGTSGSSTRRCFVCKKNSASYSTTKCNSCSRRYHNHCHPSSQPITGGPQWQCYRCIRKRVDLKRSDRAVPEPNRKANTPVHDQSQSWQQRPASDRGINSHLEFSEASELPPKQGKVSGIAATAHECSVFEIRALAQERCQKMRQTAEKEEQRNAKLVAFTGTSKSNRERERTAVDLRDKLPLSSDIPHSYKPEPVNTLGHAQAEEMTPSRNVEFENIVGVVDSTGAINQTDESRTSALPPELHRAHSVDEQLCEAQDLVEKSFAPVGAISGGTNSDGKPKKATKLNFVKWKTHETQGELLATRTALENPALNGEITETITSDVHSGRDQVADRPLSPRLVQEEPMVEASTEAPPESRQHPGRNILLSTVNFFADDHKMHHDVESPSPADSVLHQVKAKPTKTDLIMCQACGGRKTPHNPLGKSLCSRCKKEKVANVVKAIVDTASTKPNAPPEAVVNATATTSTSTTPNEQSLEHSQARPADPSNSFVPTSSTDNTTAKSDGGMRYGECTRHHEECNHQPSLKSTDNAPGFQAQNSTDTAFKVNNSALDLLFASSSQLAKERRQSTNSPSCGSDIEPTRPIMLSGERCDDGPLPNKSLEEAKKRRRESRRTTHIRAAVDEYDLGDSNTRPRNTFGRLFAMALCDAPNNRMQPSSVTKWVSDNIPGYRHGVGRWAAGIHSTMIMNVQGRSAQTIARRIKWKEGDGGEGKGDWYELLPGLRNELEHWDHKFKRPVWSHKSGSRPSSDMLKFATGDNSADDLDDDFDNDFDDDSRGQHESYSNISNSPAREQGGSPNNGQSETRTMSSQSAPEGDVMDLDDLSPHISVYKRNCLDEQPVVTKQKQPQGTSLWPVLDLSGIPPAQNREGNETPSDHDLQPGNDRISAMAQELEDDALSDEAYLGALIRQEMNTVDISEQSFHQAWPDYHPSYRFSKEDKLKEIASRKSRKEMFGKNPIYSRFGAKKTLNLRATPTRSHINLQQTPRHLRDGGSSLVIDGVPFIHVPCDTLEEFLFPGVVDELVPSIQHDQLVFRLNNGRKRDVYKTGI